MEATKEEKMRMGWVLVFKLFKGNLDLIQCSVNLGPRTVFSWSARLSPKVGNIERKKPNWECKFLFVDFMSTVEFSCWDSYYRRKGVLVVMSCAFN